jgi:hypothetical protein
MSKAFLWFGFILSTLFLGISVLTRTAGKPLFYVLWITILVGSGYKLFFAKR